MKVCPWCDTEKSLEDFYTHPRMKDGHLNKCKDCVRAYSRQHRHDNPDYYKEYENNRTSLQHRKELGRRVFNSWKQRYPERRKTHESLNNAVRDGKIVPQLCCICGNKGEAHHPDYSQPLQVVWLCSKHHKEVHHMVPY